MNNTTALNETNVSAWKDLNIETGMNLFSSMQEKVSNFLISWDLNPEGTYFFLMIIIGITALLFQMFVSASSKAGGGFNKIWFLLVTVFILYILFS